MPAFFNQATLSYNNITLNSNVVRGHYTEQMTIARSTVNPDYCPGDLITIAISIVNVCACPCTCLTLTDDLGAYNHSCGTLAPLSYVEGTARVYVNGELQDAPEVQAGPPFSISGLNVPTGGNMLVLFSARTTAYAPLGRGATITGTSTLSGGRLTAQISSSSTVETGCGVQLNITKSICPACVNCNEPVTYTLVIQNSGATPARVADHIIITDTFDPILDISEVRFNGELWHSPANYSYNSATGIFTTAAGQITVPAATFSQNMSSGAWTVTPGTSVLTITGTISSQA